MGLFVDVVCPALKVISRMERRGVPIDVGVRDRLRAETKALKERAEHEVERLAGGLHEKRRAIVQQAIDGLVAQEAALAYDGARCDKHPDYEGLTKRAKCAGCNDVYVASATFRAAYKNCGARIRVGRAILKRIGPRFKATNDHHWRWLLYDPNALALRPVGRTKKGKAPSVDDDNIVKLRRLHPDIEVLKWRVAAKQCESRLTRRLNVEPDARGRVRFRFSLHVAMNGRLASGLDKSEEDKLRRSAGNVQNIPKRDRIMYVAPEGMAWVEPDYSQIEARVQAWLARDTKMLAAFRDGLDIHALTAAAIWGCDPKETKKRLVWFDGEMKPIREAAKRRRHGGNYGMTTKGFAERFDIPLDTAARIDGADRKMWPRLYQFQEEEVAFVNRNGVSTNPFGRKVRFWFWRTNKETGRWETAEREEVLAFRPASTTAEIAKAVLPALDEIATDVGGELLIQIHDGFPTLVPTERVGEFVRRARATLERAWPQMGAIEGFGYFSCPADFKVGRNLAPRHVCGADRCDDETFDSTEGRCVWYNPGGLADYEEGK